MGIIGRDLAHIGVSRIEGEGVGVKGKFRPTQVAPIKVTSPTSVLSVLDDGGHVFRTLAAVRRSSIEITCLSF